MNKQIKRVLVGMIIMIPALVQAQVSNTIADQSYAAFNAAFLVKQSGLTFYKTALNNTEKDYFWMQALDIETPEDVFLRTNDPVVKTTISGLLYAFLSQNSDNNGNNTWNWNEYNDDIFWATLAFARGYEYTGNKTFLDQTKYGFNLAYDHTDNGKWGWDDSLGGGIWWSKKMEDKNALSNSPGVIAGCYIFKFTNDVTYLDKAKEIYAWERANIFDSTTGEVYSHVNADGTLDKGGAIFNIGAFGAAANFLYQITGDISYYNDAKLAFDRGITNKTNNGILSGGNRGGSETTEYIRYLAEFVRQNYLWNEYYSFMKNNADAAWNVRRTDLNISWHRFNQQTPTDLITGVIECNSAVVMQQLTPVVQSISDTIDGEDYNYMEGIKIQKSSVARNLKFLRLVEEGDWVEYIMDIPESGTYTFTYNVADTADCAISLLQNGQLIATTSLPNTGDLKVFEDVSQTVQLTAGIQSIKLMADKGGMNMDYWTAVKNESSKPGRIEAEEYSAMKSYVTGGVVTQITNDINGDSAVYKISRGDWMDYSIDVPATGEYLLTFRVSGTGGRIALMQGATTLANATVPNKVNAQTWTTVSLTASLTAGLQTLRLSARSAGWNINWWSIEPMNITDVADRMIDPAADVLIYPNPVVDQLTVDCGDQLILKTTILDSYGRVVAENIGNKQGSATINVSSLNSGVYFLSIQTEGNSEIVRKFVK